MHIILNIKKILYGIKCIKTGFFTYKADKYLLPKNIENLFVHMYGEVHTRQTGHFQQLYARTTKKQMCITIGGSKLWNSLETNLKEEINIHKLKKEACNYGFIHINFGLNLY